jgi:hypothetical protein
MTRHLLRLAVFVIVQVVGLSTSAAVAQGSGEVPRVFAGASVAGNIDNSVSSHIGSERSGDTLAVGTATKFPST